MHKYHTRNAKPYQSSTKVEAMRAPWWNLVLPLTSCRESLAKAGEQGVEKSQVALVKLFRKWLELF